jgi:integrase
MARTPKKQRGVYEKVPGSAVWWVRFSDGERIRREKAGTRSNAVKLYAKRITQVLGEEKLPPVRRGGYKVHQLCKNATDWYQKQAKKSMRTFKQRIDVVKQELGHFAADGLKPGDIDRWLGDHKEWSNGTRNRYKATLSKAYSLALKDGLVSTNPARLAEHWKETQTKERCLTDDEEKRIRSAILKICPKHLSAFEVAMNTGMRQGEQFTLRWDNLDMDSRTIFLSNTKNGKNRFIDMNDTVFDAFEKLKENPPADGGVFPSDRFKSSIRHPRKWWTQVLKEARVANARWHDIRHTFISRLVLAGVDLRTVQALSGHEDLSMLTRYAHLTRAHTKAAVSLLDKKRERMSTA